MRIVLSLLALALPSLASAASFDEATKEIYGCSTGKWSHLAVTRVTRFAGNGRSSSTMVLQHVVEKKFGLATPWSIERLLETSETRPTSGSFHMSYVGQEDEGMLGGSVTLTLRDVGRIVNEESNHGVNAGRFEAVLSGSGEAFEEVRSALEGIWSGVESTEINPSATKFFCEKR